MKLTSCFLYKGAACSKCCCQTHEGKRRAIHALYLCVTQGSCFFCSRCHVAVRKYSLLLLLSFSFFPLPFSLSFVSILCCYNFLCHRLKGLEMSHQLSWFVFFKHYNLDHKVRNSLDEVFLLRVIPLYDFSSPQTFKNSLHGRMPLKAPCSETDVLGGWGDAGQPSCKDHKGKVCLHDFSCLVQVSTC